MKEHKQARHFIFLSRNMLLALLMLVVVMMLSYSSIGSVAGQQNSSASPLKNKTQATNGADAWVGDTEVTAPNFQFPASASRNLSVSILFKPYYDSYNGAQTLGNPVTVAFPTDRGWIQFFESGALFLPVAQKEHVHDANDPLVDLIVNGTSDPESGIIRLPLLQALLTVGSQAPVGGLGSSLTYVDLRAATNPNLMQPAPTGHRTATPALATSQGVFVTGGTRGGKHVGHLIPQALWNYINRPDVSPDGWQTDFGPPLTGALAFTIAQNGSTHHMLVQLFWRDGLLLDQDASDSNGESLIQRLESGFDYLNTLGPPIVALTAQQKMWAQGNITLLDTPGPGQAIVHMGRDFPLTTSGDSSWNNGALWYHVQWSIHKQTRSGWAQASALTFTSPGNAPGWASFDALSPDLAAYLASFGDNVGAAVYDVTNHLYYIYNASTQFITGSSIKVPIMLTFLNLTEQQDRQPDADEMNLLTTMIENSNNDSAEALYENEDGNAAGVASYMQQLGIGGLSPYPGAFGWSLITPLTMVHLLTRLQNGTILTAQDRRLALYLMENIESDQQIGVGDTAPAGATVAMKDGWVPAPDGLWAMNTSGIVTMGRQTYIISVYTRDQNSLDDEYTIVQHVCGAVASLLL
ncbi:MAG TPA: serine hydrolase [Ktedonobacteraceae bacterium]|jgi:hypothetical protein|nr:serine hydrolase [Ktedonobacteraceae bacterium]